MMVIGSYCLEVSWEISNDTIQGSEVSPLVSFLVCSAKKCDMGGHRLTATPLTNSKFNKVNCCPWIQEEKEKTFSVGPNPSLVAIWVKSYLYMVGALVATE